MTQEEFIEQLDKEGYSYEIEGAKVIVNDALHMTITSIPSGVEFRNAGDVYLNSLTSPPLDVAFKNTGNVHLRSLTSLPPGMEFRNGGDVYTGIIKIGSLVGGFFGDWKGNIEGIDSNRLLNVMIKQGVFI